MGVYIVQVGNKWEVCFIFHLLFLILFLFFSSLEYVLPFSLHFYLQQALQQQQQQQQVFMSNLFSVYPPPPSYYKHFTPENLEKLAQWQQAHASSLLVSEPGREPPSETPPAPLSYLVPPTPPVSEPYRSFGEIWQPKDKMVSLPEMGIKQLYPTNYDRITELKKLLHSLLIQFLELVGIMGISPDQFPAKTEDIRVILINLHHLLNEYRPHQSRESLILLMEEQLEKKRKEIEELKSTNEDIQNKIKMLGQKFDKILLDAEEVGTQDDKSKEEKKTFQQLQWQLLGLDGA